MNKKAKTFRLSETALTTLSTLAKEYGLSETAVIERLLMDAATYSDCKSKDNSLLAAIKASCSNSEKNIYILIEMLNSLIMNSISQEDQIYFSTHRLELPLAALEKNYEKVDSLCKSQSKIYSNAKNDIDNFLSNMQQRKNNKR